MSPKVKKILTVSLVLWIIGVVGFSWVFREQKKEKQILQQQQEKLDNNVIKLDKMLSGEMSVQSFTDNVSRDNLQEELDRIKSRKRLARPLILAASATCMAIGILIYAYWPLSWLARYAGECFPNSNLIGRFCKYLKQTKLIQLTKAYQNKKTEDILEKSPVRSTENALGNTGYHSNEFLKESTKLDVLFCDEKSLNLKGQPTVENPAELNEKLIGQLEQNICQTVLSGYQENALRVEDSLKVQSDNLEKQVSEFRQMTQTVKEVATEQSEPLKMHLSELTEQISAIREYASRQHDRIEKLQEGYDWNIIRTFCLRVIRCIDNLESHIAKLSEQDIVTTNLEEIRDELVFALESSSVEQFKPEINSEYQGREKIAEVIKEKEKSKDTNMKGKIAKVIKPGYHYMIDDKHTKVVRVARVKLFG